MIGYETRDTRIRSVVIFGVGLLIVIVAVLFVMNRLFGFLATHEDQGPPPSPLALEREIPPAPRLQVDGTADLRTFRSGEEKVLATYGWVDQKAGVVRIPIERAIDLLAEKGLPARSQSQGLGIR